MARAEVGEALLRAAVASVRPLARRMLHHGITFGQLESRLRELFVEVAEEDFALPGRPQTDSRIALLTGINRKEVRRIRSADPAELAPTSFQRNFAASLVSRWVSDPRTTDASGRPIPLPYDAARGPSFVKLARQTTVDVRPRALLDGLVGTGAAEIRAGEVIVLTKSAYLPQRGHPEALAMLADDPPELIETMLHNVLGQREKDAERRLQQKVAYDRLGSDGLARVRAALRREADRFLQKADRVLSRQDLDRNPRAPGGSRVRAGIGVYYFEESLREKDAEERLRAPRKED